jgi:HicB family
MVRMPPALHRHIALGAKRKGKSVNRYIIDRLKPNAEGDRIKAFRFLRVAATKCA